MALCADLQRRLQVEELAKCKDLRVGEWQRKIDSKREE